MPTLLKNIQCKSLRVAGSLAATLLLSTPLLAQTPQPRITTEIANSQRAIVPGTHPPMARPELDAGRVPAATKLEGITMVFSRSAAQEAALQSLIAAQQDSASPQYHQWLTPNEFATRFGADDSDIAKVQFWLQQQGFSIDATSQSKTRLSFSGSVAQIESAFATEMHYYNVGATQHFAPSTDISVPAALSAMVQTVANLSTFRPKPHVKISTPQRAPTPNFTSSQTGSHFLTPKDIATIYDINPASKAGLTGSGQSIAIVGQSAVALTDIENFQAALGVAKKDPTVILVPNSGTSAVSTGDEMESDIDLEYSGGTATGATIFFVYVGNSKNSSVFNALSYAVEQRTAPVISISYGICESDLSSGEYSSVNGLLAQAASQGQSVVTADGDTGSTDCSGNKDQTTAEQEALSVDFPSSSQYVTAMGGSEFPAADVAAANTTYWESASGADVISSALSYIPEMVWNDDSAANGLSSGGGGVSTLTARPSWQTGVPGIPTGNFRLLPDISLTASPNNAGFLYCSSDTSTGVTGSCTPGNGFRDANNTFLTVAGGTSFDAPIFAGMLAIVNQKLNSTGQGVANATLYKLASNAATYASAFHDITSGTNECTAGPTLCSAAGESEFPAGTGYDEASGLGSVDFNNLLTAWANSTAPTTVATHTTLSPATTTPASGANDSVTVTVASASSSSTATPTGSVTVVVDGNTEAPLTLSNGSAAFTFVSSTAGAHTITATYSGNSTYASSSDTITLNVVAAAQKTFLLSATSATVTDGNSITSTITVTPQNGFTGTIAFAVTPAITNACFVLPNLAVSGSSAVSGTLTIYTSSTSCAAAGAVTSPVSKPKASAAVSMATREDLSRLFSRFNPWPFSPAAPATPNRASVSVAFASLLLIGLLSMRSRRLAAFSALLLLTVSGLAISGCSSAGSGSPSNPSTPTSLAAKGTYNLTIMGTDTASAAITASTTTTLKID
jgi:subtilase family serine protease